MRSLALLLLFTNVALGQSHRMPSMRTPSGGLAICGRCEVPAVLAPSTNLTTPGERGEPMEISGTVYEADGRTPAGGIVLFVYHTDTTGHYDPEDDPFAPRIRGWIRTGGDGHYSFRTIRPAPYPKHTEPAHIHVHVWSDRMPEHFLPEYWFAGDPLIKPADAERFAGLGSFSPIVKLERGSDGVWRGRRDIRLER